MEYHKPFIIIYGPCIIRDPFPLTNDDHQRDPVVFETTRYFYTGSLHFTGISSSVTPLVYL